MTATTNPTSDAWYRSVEKTSQTDDERIKDITVLPPPEHLIRFFPIGGTPVESLITQTRKNIHNIMAGKDDRLLVVIGPCSIHDPAAAVAAEADVVVSSSPSPGGNSPTHRAATWARVISEKAVQTISESSSAPFHAMVLRAPTSASWAWCK